MSEKRTVVLTSSISAFCCRNGRAIFCYNVRMKRDKSKLLSSEIEFSVDFNDCDPMKIVWHGNYINYFERARCALLSKIGYDYLEMEKSGYLFPVAQVRAKYVRSLRFGDVCRARAILTEWENMLEMEFELYNAKTGELTTKGTVSQICVDAKTGETQIVCPACFTDKVQKLLEEKSKDSQVL